MEFLKPYWTQQPEKKKESFSQDTSFYNSKKWRTLSKIYRRKHPFCVECESKGIAKFAEVCDHIKPVKDNPDLKLDWNNLQSLCRNCHNKKSSKERR